MKNLSHWQFVKDKNGNTVRVPVPYKCACGELSHYGKDRQWFCTFCWQAKSVQPAEPKTA